MSKSNVSLTSCKRVKKIGSSEGQITNKIIIKGNSLFQKNNSSVYSEVYSNGCILRSVGDLDNNNIYIKVSNIPVVNVGDVNISYDDNIFRFVKMENLERLQENITYYIYGESNNNIKIVVNYEQGNEDYYGFTNNFVLRNPSSYTLSSIRFYCDAEYYGQGLEAGINNVYFKDITTSETSTNTNTLTINVTESLKRIGNVYDSLDLETGILRRCIGSRAYNAGDENDNSVLTDYNKTLYVLDVPTEEVVDVDCLQIKLLENSFLWLNNNIIPTVTINYESANVKNIESYCNPLARGAAGDGIEDDSDCFDDYRNYIPQGYTFKIDRKTALKLQNSNTIGKGILKIINFPHDPRQTQLQGTFNASDLKDEFKMCMNLPNEATPHGAQMRQKVSGWFPFEEAEIPAGYQVLNTWGQVFLINGESYPANALIHISNLTLLGYRESNKCWEILNNPDNIGSGLYYEDYHDNSSLPVDSSVKNHVYTAKINSSTAGRVLHVWSDQCYITDLNSDFKYICVYMDAWVTGDNNTTTNSEVLNKFVMNIGSDDRANYDGYGREMCGGRFLKLTNVPRRCYATNLNAEIIDEYATQSLIESISYAPAKHYGRTHDTPKAPMKGEYYFDYQKNKVLYWNGSSWVDSSGN